MCSEQASQEPVAAAPAACGLVDGRVPDGVRRLAIAVLRQATEDAEGTGARAVQAQAWLHGNSLALPHWCACAGIGTPAAVQRYLRRARAGAPLAWPRRCLNDEAA